MRTGQFFAIIHLEQQDEARNGL